MTHRFSGSRKAHTFASSLINVSLLTALAGSGLASCNAADPAPVGAGKQDGTSGEPTEPGAGAPTLPDGVTMSTDANGNPIYVDEMGNVLEAVPVTNPDGSTGMVLQDPDTGDTVGMVTPPPSTAPASPVVVVDPDDDLIIMEPDVPPVMDGDLVEGVVCNSAEVSFEPVIPTVMLLIDRSTSMFHNQVPPYVGGSPTPVGDYPDRWEATRAAVDLLAPYSADIQFGAMTYTGFKPENGDGSCPTLQGEGGVIALDNFATVQALLPDSATAIPAAKSETPTAEAIVAATTALAAVESDGPKYLVLLTDGLPEMCGHFDQGVYCGADRTIAATQAAYALGIQTFVIGIGFRMDDPSEWGAAQYMMNAVAHAGQGLDVAPPSGDHLNQFIPCLSGEARAAGETEPPELYTGENWRMLAKGVYGAAATEFADTLYLLPGDNDLGAQLAQVVEATRSCSFEMADSVIRAQAGKGAVQLQLADGTTQDLVYGDANGWDLDATRDDLVVVQGTACAQVQDQGVVSGVKIEFPCEIRIPKAR